MRMRQSLQVFQPIQRLAPTFSFLYSRLALAWSIPFRAWRARFITQKTFHPPQSFILYPTRFGIQEHAPPFLDLGTRCLTVGHHTFEIAARLNHSLAQIIPLKANAKTIPRSNFHGKA